MPFAGVANVRFSLEGHPVAVKADVEEDSGANSVVERDLLR